MVVPNRLVVRGGREMLEARHPITGDDMTVRLDDLDGFEIAPGRAASGRTCLWWRCTPMSRASATGAREKIPVGRECWWISATRGELARHDLWVSEPATTNNRMALRSVIESLGALSRKGGRFRIVFCTDSRYIVDGMSQWVHDWIRRGWTRKTGPIENLGLWQLAVSVAAPHVIQWRWVRGHAGHAQTNTRTISRCGPPPRSALRRGSRRPASKRGLRHEKVGTAR